jgi:DNA (cytosine-5)-methyltransferase 1
MSALTVGSVCSGYGGLEMALAQVMDIDVRWHAEIDPDAAKVLKTRWPDVPNLGDFTVPGWAAEPVDVECGGVPCQPFSAAGRQQGTSDPRFLWPDWRRGIAERRPATVIFENVANLTRGKMRPIFDSIIGDLLDLGYDVRWCLLGACAVGAAHHRHRVFLLACRTRTAPNARQVEVQTCGQHAAAYVPTPVVTDARGARNQTSGRTEGKKFHGGTTLGDMITAPPRRRREAVTETGRDAPTPGSLRRPSA